jgi:hypothetical protein
VKAALGLKVSDWEDNFARSCAYYCSKIPDRDDFDFLTAQYRNAFDGWDGGRHAHAFKPKFSGHLGNYVAYSGLVETSLYVNDGLSGAATPHQLYTIMAGMQEPLETADFTLTTKWKQAESGDLALQRG